MSLGEEPGVFLKSWKKPREGGGFNGAGKGHNNVKSCGGLKREESKVGAGWEGYEKYLNTGRPLRGIPTSRLARARQEGGNNVLLQRVKEKGKGNRRQTSLGESSQLRAIKARRRGGHGGKVRH